MTVRSIALPVTPTSHLVETFSIADARRTTNLPALTGIRGVAALWVFFHHWNLFVYGTGRGMHPLSVGYLAVDMFFILSGFVMTHSRHRQFVRPSLGEYAGYMGERLMRLYPTNAAVVLIYAGIFLLAPAAVAGDTNALFTMRSAVSSLTMTNAWPVIGGRGWIAPGWSVSLEILAYVCLPLILAVTRRLSARSSIVVAVLCLLIFLASVLAHGDHDPNVKSRGGVIRLACEFVAGSALYQFWRTGRQPPVWIGSVVASALLTAALSIPIPEAQFLALPAFLLIVLSSAEGASWIAQSFSGFIPSFLGRISYSLYLVHWPALILFQHYGGFGASLLVKVPFAMTVLAAATGLHYAVEAPSHRLARRLKAALPKLSRHPLSPA